MKNDRCLIFDIQFGASGDMLLAALVDLGLEPKTLTGALRGLPVDGWSITAEKINRHHFSGTKLTVSCPDEAHERGLLEIGEILHDSSLSPTALEKALHVFEVLAAAEAEVHGITPDKVHFHEVGALDSILDIAAFCAAMDILNVRAINYGDIFLGKGTVPSRHGELPQPAPAVCALVRGKSVVFTERNGEIITPTAAAILTALGSQLTGPLTPAALISSGRGFGTREYPFPSYTRAFLTERNSLRGDDLIQLECNIDDMNPQIYPRLIDLLLEHGALDAYCIPLIMKKGRPGTGVVVISEPADSSGMKEIIYRETSTLGIREIGVRREKLDRGFEKIDIPGGTVRIKTACLGGKTINAQPEFEDCRSIADKTGTPLKLVLEQAMREYYRKNPSGGNEI